MMTSCCDRCAKLDDSLEKIWFVSASHLLQVCYDDYATVSVGQSLPVRETGRGRFFNGSPVRLTHHCRSDKMGVAQKKRSSRRRSASGSPADSRRESPGRAIGPVRTGRNTGAREAESPWRQGGIWNRRPGATFSEDGSAVMSGPATGTSGIRTARTVFCMVPAWNERASGSVRRVCRGTGTLSGPHRRACGRAPSRKNASAGRRKTFLARWGC